MMSTERQLLTAYPVPLFRRSSRSENSLKRVTPSRTKSMEKESETTSSLKRASLSSSTRMLLRSKSYTGVSLQLHVIQLEIFLTKLSEAISDNAEVAMYAADFEGLASLCQKHDDARRRELKEALEFLEILVDLGSNLPSHDVAEAYSYMGQIRHEQGRHASAVQFFLKTLWIQSASNIKDEDRVKIALTESRLGLAYGQMGRYKQAIALLEKALESFEEAYMRSNHRCMLQVGAALAQYRILQQETEASPTSVKDEAEERLAQMMNAKCSKSTRGLLFM